MIKLSFSLFSAVVFTKKGKTNKVNLLTVTSFRQAEYRRYVQAAQNLYPMWILILNERTVKELRTFAHLVVYHLGYMIYRLHEIRATNISLPLFRQGEINFLLDTLTEMYNSLLEETTPDAVAAVHDILMQHR